MPSKLRLSLLLGLIVVILFIGTVQAAAPLPCSLTSAYLIQVDFVNNSGAPIDIYWIDFSCGQVLYRTALPNGATHSQGTFPTHPWIVYNAITHAPLYCFVAQVNATITVTSTYQNYCNSSTPEPAVPFDDTIYPPDERINWQYGDLSAVLYAGSDSEGNPAINVYCYDGTNTWLGMQVNAANMESGMSAEGCDARFYYIEDSAYPYQWNIYYDGKLYETMCSDLTCEDRTSRYFDPNE